MPSRHQTIELPLPPSINHYYRPTNKVGRLRLGPDAEAFRWEVKAATQRFGAPAEGKVALIVGLYLVRDTDIDNRLKALLDALQDRLYRNDRQIVRLVVNKVRSKRAYCTVRLIELEKEDRFNTWDDTIPPERVQSTPE